MSRSLFFSFAVILSLLLPVSSFAQDFPMLHYSIDDGLPSNNIYNIYRDSKGFLWFATDKGIARYNGLKFETFTTFDGLPDNEIFLFKEDYNGRLWLSTYNGELCYYKDGVFHTAANTPFLKMPFKMSHIYNITLESDSSLTFNFFNTFIGLNIKNEKISILNFKKSKYVNSDFKDLSFIVYKRKLSPYSYELVLKDGIVIIDTCYKILKKIDRNFSVQLIYIPSQDNGYFTNNSYIFSQELDTICSLKKGNFQSRLVHAYYYGDSNSFIASNTGLIINDTIETLTGNNISSITQDISGNYWVSTLNNGIYCFKRNFLHFKLFKDIYPESIKYSKVINGVLYYVTLDNSLYKWEKETPVCLLNANEHFGKDNYVSKDGAYLIDTVNKEFLYINRSNIMIYNWASKKAFKCKYFAITDIYGVKDVYSIDGFLYIRGRSEITKIDFRDLKTKDSIGYIFLGADNLQRIYGMAMASGDTLWYSTLTNMYKYAGDSFINQPQFKNIAFKSFIFFNKYLVGYTHDNQFFICDYAGKKIKVDTSASQNCIWDKLYEIDNNHLLISTNGLYRLLTVKYIGKEQVVSISIIEDPFIPKQTENICIDSFNCYFFKKNSIISINKNTLSIKPFPPKLYFTFLKSSKKSYPINSQIEIPYNESRNITVSFSRLLFNAYDISQQYAISKNGQDNWIDVKGEEINFVNPGYGDYVIKIRAKSLSSDYCEPIIFTLHILRPYWATWWFIALIICTLITTGILITRYRVSYILRKNEREHATEVKFIKSEYKALNALMNPHFIFNTLNNVQGLVNRNDKLAANEYLRVFADLIRQNMHNISKELIPLQKEIDLVVNYLLLEKLRFKDFLNYGINIENGIDLSEILVPPLLVQPLVENSIKHGILPLESEKGLVSINIYERNGILFIEVKDNGIGMTRSQNKPGGSLHESFGMENIKKRIQQLSIIQNKEITFNVSELNDGKGSHEWTIVTISMPIA